MASFLGIYGVIIGLIVGIIIALFSFLAVSALKNIPNSPGSLNITQFGFFSILIFPLLFGFINFMSGLIITPLMNLSLRIIHGIEVNIDIEEKFSNQNTFDKGELKSQSSYDKQYFQEQEIPHLE